MSVEVWISLGLLAFVLVEYGSLIAGAVAMLASAVRPEPRVSASAAPGAQSTRPTSTAEGAGQLDDGLPVSMPPSIIPALGRQGGSTSSAVPGPAVRGSGTTFNQLRKPSGPAGPHACRPASL